MLFTDLRKDELVAAASYYRVDYDGDWTKAAIATALLDAGHTPEQWAKDSEANDYGLGPDDNGAVSLGTLKGEEGVSDDVHVDESPVVPEANEESAQRDDDLVLVRFVGRNKSYATGRFRFTAVRPFALMSSDEFESLDPALFREASKAEAAEFYNE